MKKLVMILVVLAALTGCKRWIETDLSEESVELVSPPNNYVDSLSQYIFYWEDLDGVDEYQFQLVSPNFDTILNFVADSMVEVNSVTFNLNPGKYQWRVMGSNSTSETAFTTYNLEVISTDYLTGESINLITPSNQFNTNSSYVFFDWTGLNAASSYLFTIFDNSSGDVVYSTDLTEDSITVSISEEGKYRWKVQAINDVSASYPSERTFIYDATAPLAATLISPSHLDTLDRFDIELSWLHATDNGSALIDSISVGMDSLMSSTVLSELAIESFVVDSLDAGDYWWNVTTYDAAGNGPATSVSRKLIVE